MKNKIILALLILSMIALVFSGCDGGNPIVPPINSEPLEGPYINNIDPSSGAPGIEVTINGGNFSPLLLGPRVLFGSAWQLGIIFSEGIIESHNDTQIKVYAPPRKEGTVDVYVETDFIDSNKVEFVYKGPVITNIIPPSGMPGTEVTIEGRDFGSRGDGPFYDSYCHVKFGKSTAKIIKWEDKKIVVEAPSDYGTGIDDVEFISNITSLATGGLWGAIIEIFTGLFIPMVESPLGTIGGVTEEVEVATSAGTGKSVFTWGGEVNTFCNVCNLPTYPINVRMDTGSSGSCFDTELKNVGSGYDIYDGIWVGWCADSETAIETNEWYQGYIYCSYNPSNRYGIDWPKINWIINNKDSYSADYIQDAIWHFTNGLAPNGLAMAAETHSNFCPQSGQKYITIIDVPGKQHTFIEIPVE